MKSGFITVIGLPNAGKSSLVNKITQENVSIVTSKPQTTRKRTLGIMSEKDKYQMVFIDTPGFVEGDKGLNKFLKQELDESFKGIQIVVATIGPWEFKTDQKPWSVEVAEKIKTQVIFVATQADVRAPDMEKWKTWSGQELLVTSVKTGQGIEQLKEKILELLPEGPEYYDPETYTDQTMRELSSEIIRKHCFENLHQEVPYGLAIDLRDFKEDHVYKIHADIILARESHKPMVIGQGGQMLKRIGTNARKEMEKSFGHGVFLKLHVVVKDQWIKDEQRLKELGYGH